MEGSYPIEFRDMRPLTLSSADEEAALDELSSGQVRQVLRLIEHVNLGLELDHVLEELYTQSGRLLSCDRIGLALVTAERTSAVARFAKSNRPIFLKVGYQAPLAGSSLKTVLETRRVRILGDLEAYYREHPESISTRLLLEEGMRSSLTCPLYAREQPLGFLFFTSARPRAYDDAHVRFYTYLAAQVATVIEKARLYSDLAGYLARVERDTQRIHRELELARQLQRTFVPERPPQVPGLDMAFVYEPAVEVGGDLVEFLPQEDGRLLVFAADAMGHGVPAAMAMAAVKAMFLSIAAVTLDPAEILRRLNATLPPVLQQHFAAAMALVIDPVAGELTFSRAGLPPLVLMRSTGEVGTLDEGGLPLSLEASEPYGVTRVRFEAGDVLVLNTDGLTEMANANGEQFSSERIKGLLRGSGVGNAQVCMDRLMEGLARFRGETAPKDDMSIVVICRQ